MVPPVNRPMHSPPVGQISRVRVRTFFGGFVIPRFSQFPDIRNLFKLKRTAELELHVDVNGQASSNYLRGRVVKTRAQAQQLTSAQTQLKRDQEAGLLGEQFGILAEPLLRTYCPNWFNGPQQVREECPIRLTRVAVLQQLKNMPNQLKWFDKFFPDLDAHQFIDIAFTFHPKNSTFNPKNNAVIITSIDGFTNYSQVSSSSEFKNMCCKFEAFLTKRFKPNKITFRPVTDVNHAHNGDYDMRLILWYYIDDTIVVPKTDNTQTKKNTTKKGHRSTDFPVGKPFLTLVTKINSWHLKKNGVFYAGSVYNLYVAHKMLFFGPLYSPALNGEIGPKHIIRLVKKQGLKQQKASDFYFDQRFKNENTQQYEGCHASYTNDDYESLRLLYHFVRMGEKAETDANDILITNLLHLNDLTSRDPSVPDKMLQKHQKLIETVIELRTLFCLFLNPNSEAYRRQQEEITDLYRRFRYRMNDLGISGAIITTTIAQIQANIMASLGAISNPLSPQKNMTWGLSAATIPTMCETVLEMAAVTAHMVLLIEVLIPTQGNLLSRYKDPNSRRHFLRRKSL